MTQAGYVATLLSGKLISVHSRILCLYPSNMLILQICMRNLNCACAVEIVRHGTRKTNASGEAGGDLLGGKRSQTSYALYHINLIFLTARVGEVGAEINISA